MAGVRKKISDLVELVNYDENTFLEVIDLNESLAEDQNKKMLPGKIAAQAAGGITFNFVASGASGTEMTISGSGGTRTVIFSQTSIGPITIRPMIQDLVIGTYLLLVSGTKNILLEMTAQFSPTNGTDSAATNLISISSSVFVAGDIVSLTIITI